MAEDEEGYRKLIDQKKDKRLAFLLSQTDEYIASLTEMVKQHKIEQKRKQQEEQKRKRKKKKRVNADGTIIEEDDNSQGSDCRVTVVEVATGKVLTGEDAPMYRELQDWLAAHPGWEAIESDDESESEDGM